MESNYNASRSLVRNIWMVDNYSPINFATDWSIFSVESVHPSYNGSRKFAVNFWKAFRLSEGDLAADSVCVLDGDGAGATIKGGSSANTAFGTAPATGTPNSFNRISASTTADGRSKLYLRFDLNSKATDWDNTKLALVWHGRDYNSNIANTSATYQLYALPDGQDAWSESTITWNNAPLNDTAGDGLSAGAQLLATATVPWATNSSASEVTTSLDATFERVTVADSLTEPKRFVRVEISAL